METTTVNAANRKALDLEMKSNLWSFHNATNANTNANAKANAQAKLGACMMILAAGDSFTGDVEALLPEMYATIDEVGARYEAA
jgi:hypothetical protein